MSNLYTNFLWSIHMSVEELAWAKEELTRLDNQDSVIEDEFGTYTEAMPILWSDKSEDRQLGINIWSHDQDYGDMDASLEFVQSFLAKWRPDGFLELEFSNSASELVYDAFSGGTLLVTAQDVYSPHVVPVSPFHAYELTIIMEFARAAMRDDFFRDDIAIKMDINDTADVDRLANRLDSWLDDNHN